MFDISFGHGTIRKYYAYFAALFSNIHIDRTLKDGSKSARIHVPVVFAKKEKALTRVEDDPNIDKKDALFVPVMAFDMVDMRYQPNRKSPTMAYRASKVDGDANRFHKLYAPVNYDFHFRLYVLVKNVDDGLKIVEQILAYFTPDLTSRIEIIPEMGIVHQVPLILQSVAMEDDIPQTYSSRVTRIWVLDFVLEGVLYGPVHKSPVIKFTNTVFTGASSLGSIDENPYLKVTIQPGLTADGEPTDDPDKTISYLSIFVDDDYGYVVKVEDQ